MAYMCQQKTNLESICYPEVGILRASVVSVLRAMPGYVKVRDLELLPGRLAGVEGEVLEAKALEGVVPANLGSNHKS